MKETKTVQVYPDDDIVNNTIEEYGSFGWEVINNQRCQEYEGQTHGTDGGLTNHYSTFNKITFTREKSSPWYDDVTKLEKEYNDLESTIKSYKNRKPVSNPPKHSDAKDIVVCILLYFLYIIPGIIFTVVICKANAKYKKYMNHYSKDLSEYNKVYPTKIKELESKQLELRYSAERLVLGKA